MSANCRLHSGGSASWQCLQIGAQHATGVIVQGPAGAQSCVAGLGTGSPGRGPGQTSVAPAQLPADCLMHPAFCCKQPAACVHDAARPHRHQDFNLPPSLDRFPTDTHKTVTKLSSICHSCAAPWNSIGMFACITWTAPCTPRLPSMLAMNCMQADIFVSLHQRHYHMLPYACKVPSPQGATHR